MARIVRPVDLDAARARTRGQRPRPASPLRGAWRQLWRSPLERLAMLVAFTSMVFVGAVLLSEGVFDIWLAPSRTAAPVYAVQFAPCSGPSRVTCVVDGDTIWLEGRKIRLADIDTPEVTSPHCAYELSLGHRATERLTQLLNAGPFSVERAGRDKDIYSRDLRIVTRNGNSLGDVLVREGLAHVWDGGKHSWCG